MNFSAFYEILLEAKCVGVGERSQGRCKAGRKLSYVTKMLYKCYHLMGKAYTAQLGLEPGDEFEIKVGHKQVKLFPIGTAHEKL